MDRTADRDTGLVDAALARFDRWHADEMSRIGSRGRGPRAVILGSGVVLLVMVMGMAAWFF